MLDFDDPRRQKRRGRLPQMPQPEQMPSINARALDPSRALPGATVDGIEIYPTLYVGNRLLVSKAVDFQTAFAAITEAAKPLGWGVEEVHDPVTGGLPFGVRSVKLFLEAEDVALAPDAWVVLQQARRQDRDAVNGVSLDHVV
ncbi:hypothetical protein ACH5WX_11630, partial [Nocardioides sp. CER28]